MKPKNHRSMWRLIVVLTILASSIGLPNLVSASPVQDDNAGSWTDSFAASAGSLSASSQAGINTADSAIELTKNDGSGTFAAPHYTSGTATSVVVAPATFAHWNQLSFNVTNTANTSVKIQVYRADGTTLVPDTALPGNSAGFSSSPVDLSSIPYSTTTGLLVLKSTLATINTTDTPRLTNWTVTWAKYNGLSSSPTLSTGPWATTNHDSRNTNQMDGTLASAYTVAWYNPTVVASLLDANSDVVGQQSVSNTSQPFVVQTLNQTDGTVKNSLQIDDNGLSTGAPRIEALTKDNTVYLSSTNNNTGITARLLALRNGQLLWDRYINENSGYGGYINLDSAGNLIVKSGHGQISKYTLDGTRIWETFADFWNWAGTVAIGSNDTIYNKSSQQRYDVLTPVGVRTVSAALSSGNFGLGSPSVDSDGSVYFAEGTNGATCPGGPWDFRKTDQAGTTLWDVTVPQPASLVSTAPVIDSQYVYLRALCSDQIYVYNKSDGSLAKTLNSSSASTTYHPNNSGQVVVDHAQQLLEPTTNQTISLVRPDSSQPWHYVLNAAGGYHTIGNASQWYTGMGSGTVAFKPWNLSAAVSAPSLQVGQTVTITATSSMLRRDPIATADNQVQAVLPDGTKVPLAFARTDVAGNSVWQGSYTVPAGKGGIGTGTIAVEANAWNTQTSQNTSFASPLSNSNNSGLVTYASFSGPLPGLPNTGRVQPLVPTTPLLFVGGISLLGFVEVGRRVRQRYR